MVVSEPHWHPNTAELSYCLSGSAVMTIFSPDAGHDTFTVSEGDMVYVPNGYLHHIENINHGKTKFAIAFNHEMPEDIGISGSTGSMTDRVLGATFGLRSEYFGNFKKSNHDLIITSKSDYKVTTDTYQRVPNYHKFNLKPFPPTVQNKGGTVSLGNTNNFGIHKIFESYFGTVGIKFLVVLGF